MNKIKNPFNTIAESFALIENEKDMDSFLITLELSKSLYYYLGDKKELVEDFIITSYMEKNFIESNWKIELINASLRVRFSLNKEDHAWVFDLGEIRPFREYSVLLDSEKPILLDEYYLNKKRNIELNDISLNMIINTFGVKSLSELNPNDENWVYYMKKSYELGVDIELLPILKLNNNVDKNIKLFKFLDRNNFDLLRYENSNYVLDVIFNGYREDLDDCDNWSSYYSENNEKEISKIREGLKNKYINESTYYSKVLHTFLKYDIELGMKYLLKHKKEVSIDNECVITGNNPLLTVLSTPHKNVSIDDWLNLISVSDIDKKNKQGFSCVDKILSWTVPISLYQVPGLSSIIKESMKDKNKSASLGGLNYFLSKKDGVLTYVGVGDLLNKLYGYNPIYEKKILSSNQNNSDSFFEDNSDFDVMLDDIDVESSSEYYYSGEGILDKKHIVFFIDLYKKESLIYGKQIDFKPDYIEINKSFNGADIVGSILRGIYQYKAFMGVIEDDKLKRESFEALKEQNEKSLNILLDKYLNDSSFLYMMGVVVLNGIKEVGLELFKDINCINEVYKVYLETKYTHESSDEFDKNIRDLEVLVYESKSKKILSDVKGVRFKI